METATRSCKKCHKDKEINAQNWKAKFSAAGLELTASAVNASTRRQKQCERSAARMTRRRRILPKKDESDIRGDIKSFSALVDITSLGDSNENDTRDCADRVAELVWDRIGYRFHSSHKSKKKPDGAKHIDNAQMRTFPCQGWCHEKYVCIDVPDDVKQYISANSKLRPPQLWKEILKSHPYPAFSNKHHWRRHNDELDSAKILLKELVKSTQRTKLNPFLYPRIKMTALRQSPLHYRL
ncbi:hypothetical protein B0H13DRAFT_1886610 [Mycena leptocephala]|nr:hypothetical protein B0H13DRAFT_1886610 [Mycena leptocephala]